MNLLLESGADFYQGNLFSEPIAPHNMESMLNRFHEIDEALSLIRNRRIDLSALFLEENNYVLTPDLYRLINRCIHRLIYDKDISHAVQHIIELVGDHMDVSRAYVFKRDEGNIYSNTHEWCAKGIEPQKNLLTRVLIPESWTTALSEDGMIIAIDIANLPEETSLALAAQNIKSVAVIPLWDGSELSGFVGFDDCVNYRDWRAAEIITLHNLCVSIAIVMNMLRVQQELDRLKSLSLTQ
jgi:GAF domain-containing protein